MRAISEDIIYNVKLVLSMDGITKSDREIAEFFGISKTSVNNIRRWGHTRPPENTGFHGDQFLQVPTGGRRAIPRSVKQMVVEDYENSDLTIREIADKYNVGVSSVVRWSASSEFLEFDDG